MNKAALRQQIHQDLEKLNFQELIEKSGRLNQQFESWAKTDLTAFASPSHKKTILSFCPFGTEPQIQIEPFLAESGSIKIGYLRIADWNARKMEAREARRDLPGQWEEFDVPGGNMIFHPLASQPLCDLDQVIAILVPGLGFSPEGARLGRGAAFYDRFLLNIPQALRIGVAFDLQIKTALPMDDHDLHVDMILTESRVIATNRYNDWKNHGRIKRG